MIEYIYDNTFEGLLTAIFYAYPSKVPVKISRALFFEPTLITEPIEIKTDEDKFNRVYKSIELKLSSNTLKNVFYLFLSDLKNVEDLILNYLKLCYRFGDNINLAKNNDIIINVDKISRKVTLEAHRFTGFVRFSEISPLTYYAKIEPDHNIIPLITNHFIKRFSDQNFIIHDIKRNSALLYNKTDYVITSLSEKENSSFDFGDYNDNFEILWKDYFNSTTIKERINTRLQKRSMPIRYWSNLTELK